MMVVADQGRKTGGAHSWYKAAHIDTWRWAQKRVTEAGGWRVAGVVDVQVEHSFLWESGWRASA